MQKMRLQKAKFQAKSGGIIPDFLHPYAISRTADALRPLKAHQLPACHKQVGQRTGDKETIGLAFFASPR